MSFSSTNYTANTFRFDPRSCYHGSAGLLLMISRGFTLEQSLLGDIDSGNRYSQFTVDNEQNSTKHEE